MRIYQRNHFLSPSTEFTKRVIDSVLDALSLTTDESEFVGNDTLWFQRNPQGRLTPTAMNSARYLSKSVLRNLAGSGWEIEKRLSDQTFDAYLEAEQVIEIFDVDLGLFPDLLRRIWGIGDGEDFHALLLQKAWHELFVRGFRISEEKIPETFYGGLQSTKQPRNLRVGLEFETGNIASSFRSITKLSVLYKANMIDFGVLITFKDKAGSACRLFPVSNRNGSFEELDNRKFKDFVDFPLWEVGFEPDRFDPEARYLGNEPGHLFVPDFIEEAVIAGDTYEKYRTYDGREVFKRPTSG